MNALNPVVRIGDQVAEPLMVHNGLDKESAGSAPRRCCSGSGSRETFCGVIPSS